MSTTSQGVPGLPTLTEVRMHLASPAAPCVGRVVETRRCTASAKAAGFVRHIAFDISGTPLEGAFRAGQSFGVVPPGLDNAGKPHKLRLYSLASPSFGEDGEGKIVATTVKRTIDEHWETHALFLGVASNYLCNLREGDSVTLTGPSGKRFVLPADPTLHDYIFIATGTGIAPFRGMILELLRTAPSSRITLIMGSPYASDLLYHRELTAMAAAHPGLTYLTAISRERQEDSGPGMYVHQRLSTHRDSLAPMLCSERTLVYICGIAGMELGVMQTLANTLPPEALAQYLAVDDSAGPPEAWDRRMIHKQVAPTRRMFLEVY
ncbi:MAG: hypothetical protein KF859_13385 [Phycisphaeraceae bacterium]|nr:hypothetical protein [Phycisphaeraceae bacterium]